MKQVFWILVSLFFITAGLLFYIASQYVFRTGDIVWISDSNTLGRWAKNKTSKEWLAKISSKDSALTIVYLSPYTEYSSTALLKNELPVAYVNWGKWGPFRVLRISMEWGEWNKIDDSKNNHLAYFISQQLSREWGLPEDIAVNFSSPILKMDPSPIELK